MKVFSSEYIERDLINDICREENIYHSKEFDCFITTDKVFNSIKEKYKFTEDEDLSDNNITYNYVVKVHSDFEEVIDWYVSDMNVEYFGYFMYLSEVKGVVATELKDKINEESGEISFIKSDDWFEDLMKIIKQKISYELRERMLNEIKKFKDDGYDLACIADAFK